MLQAYERLVLTQPRLLIWYTIVTAVFRCPSSATDLTQSSPALCKPYLHARAQVDPYLKPYYDTYAGPYVDAATPYIDAFQARVYTPTSEIVSRSYTAYAAPTVHRALQYSEKQWDKMPDSS